jgi:hypothetical protein
MPAKLRRKSLRYSGPLPQLATQSSSSFSTDPYSRSSPPSSHFALPASTSTQQLDWEQQQSAYDYLHPPPPSFHPSHPSLPAHSSPLSTNNMAHQQGYGSAGQPEQYDNRSQDPYYHQQHQQQHQQFNAGPPPQSFSRPSSEQRSYSPQGAPSPGGHPRNGSYGGQPQPQQQTSSSRPYPSSSSSPSGPPSFNPTPARQSPVPSYRATPPPPGPGAAASRQLPSQASSRSLASQAAGGGGVGAPGGAGTGAGGPPTIAGEPLHDLNRAFALLKSSKFYAEGAFFPFFTSSESALTSSFFPFNRLLDEEGGCWSGWEGAFPFSRGGEVGEQRELTISSWMETASWRC